MTWKVKGNLRMDKVTAHNIVFEYCRTKCGIGRGEDSRRNILLCRACRVEKSCPLMKILKDAPIVKLPSLRELDLA